MLGHRCIDCGYINGRSGRCQMCGSNVLLTGVDGSRDALYLLHVAKHGSSDFSEEARADWIRLVSKHLLERAFREIAFEGFILFKYRWVENKRELELSEWRPHDAAP